MPFNIGDIVTFNKVSDYMHVARCESTKKLFPNKDSRCIISYVRKSSDTQWYVRIEGIASEEFFAERFKLVEKSKYFNPKYALVINKIKQMELKRKANGYAF